MFPFKLNNQPTNIQLTSCTNTLAIINKTINEKNINTNFNSYLNDFIWTGIV